MDHFWSIFPILGVKFFFPENLALFVTISYGFLAPCQNLEKTNNKIPRKSLESKDRWMDRQTLFHRTLPPTARGLKKEGKIEIQKFEYLENEKSLLDEIKKSFSGFCTNYHLVKKRKIADTSLKDPLQMSLLILKVFKGILFPQKTNFTSNINFYSP